MKKIQYIILLAMIAMALVSCEKTIDLELDNVEPRIVIEAVITDQPGPNTVKISRTGNFFEANEFPLVSGAVITVSDNSGRSETLKEMSTGIYKTDSIVGKIGNTYTLNVKLEGREYSAVSTMQEPIAIDSLRYEFNKKTGPGMGKDPGYTLHVYFKDRPGIRDYCMVKLFVNDKQDEAYYLYNGKLGTGEIVDFQRFRQRFAKDDNIRVELLTLEFSLYDYFSTLSNIMSSEGIRGIVSTGTPANPNTNLTNGALGYFAVYAMKTGSVVIK